MNTYVIPSKWKRQEEVFHILDNETPNNTEVTVACAVQALNIYYLPDFIQWKLTQGFKKINMWSFGAGAINYHFVYHPPLKCKSVTKVVPNKNVEKNTKHGILVGRKLGTRSSVGTKVKSTMTNGVMLDMESAD